MSEVVKPETLKERMQRSVSEREEWEKRYEAELEAKRKREATNQAVKELSSVEDDDA